MPEVCCTGATRDGVKICDLHEQPLIERSEAQVRGVTKTQPNVGAEWFCPVSGSGFAFGEADTLHDELSGV